MPLDIAAPLITIYYLTCSTAPVTAPNGLHADSGEDKHVDLAVAEITDGLADVLSRLLVGLAEAHHGHLGEGECAPLETFPEFDAGRLG